MSAAQIDHEARICAAVEQVMARYRDALADVKLRLEFRGIAEDDNDNGVSEARIRVYEGDEWVDSLEFFVRREREPVSSPAEVEAWLSEQIERLIADHPWGGGWTRV